MSIAAKYPLTASLDSTPDYYDDAAMYLTTIQNDIRNLDPAERASLIDLLGNSLDTEHVKDIEAKWAAESEDRIEAFERGELPAVDGPSAVAELPLSLRNDEVQVCD